MINQQIYSEYAGHEGYVTFMAETGYRMNDVQLLESVSYAAYGLGLKFDDYIFIRSQDDTLISVANRDLHVSATGLNCSMKTGGVSYYPYSNLNNKVSVEVTLYDFDGDSYTYESKSDLDDFDIRGISNMYSLEFSIPSVPIEVHTIRIKLKFDYIYNVFDGIPRNAVNSQVTREYGFHDAGVSKVVISSEEVGLLKRIINQITELPSALSDMLKDFFLPDQDSLVSIRDRFDLILADHFGCVYEVVGLFNDLTDALLETSTDKDTVELPAVTIPLPGSSFTFGPYVVPLIPDRFDTIINTLKSFIGIMCTLAFLNMLKNRYEEVITK